MSKGQNNRALRAIHRLNNIRHKQAKKIDILCNDMVSAHGDFVNQLSNLVFTASFYESLLGCSDLDTLLSSVSERIQRLIPGISIAVYLSDIEGFELHAVDQSMNHKIEPDELAACFNRELAENISRANWICSLDDMFKMGLTGNPKMLSQICAVGVPLGRFGKDFGFLLLYRQVCNKFTKCELEKVKAVTPGLHNAINSCLTLAQNHKQGC